MVQGRRAHGAGVGESKDTSVAELQLETCRGQGGVTETGSRVDDDHAI